MSQNLGGITFLHTGPGEQYIRTWEQIAGSTTNNRITDYTKGQINEFPGCANPQLIEFNGDLIVGYNDLGIRGTNNATATVKKLNSDGSWSRLGNTTTALTTAYYATYFRSLAVCQGKLYAAVIQEDVLDGYPTWKQKFLSILRYSPSTNSWNELYNHKTTAYPGHTYGTQYGWRSHGSQAQLVVSNNRLFVHFKEEFGGNIYNSSASTYRALTMEIDPDTLARTAITGLEFDTQSPGMGVYAYQIFNLPSGPSGTQEQWMVQMVRIDASNYCWRVFKFYGTGWQQIGTGAYNEFGPTGNTLLYHTHPSLFWDNDIGSVFMAYEGLNSNRLTHYCLAYAPSSPGGTWTKTTLPLPLVSQPKPSYIGVEYDATIDGFAKHGDNLYVAQGGWFLGFPNKGRLFAHRTIPSVQRIGGDSVIKQEDDAADTAINWGATWPAYHKQFQIVGGVGYFVVVNTLATSDQYGKLAIYRADV